MSLPPSLTVDQFKRVYADSFVHLESGIEFSPLTFECAYSAEPITKEDLQKKITTFEWIRNGSGVVALICFITTDILFKLGAAFSALTPALILIAVCAAIEVIDYRQLQALSHAVEAKEPGFAGQLILAGQKTLQSAWKTGSISIDTLTKTRKAVDEIGKLIVENQGVGMEAVCRQFSNDFLGAENRV